MSPVAIFNPLPHALHHYVTELEETLARCGVETTSFPAPGVEGTRSVLRKAGRLLAHVRAARRAARSHSDVICVWPVLGWYELALWSLLRPRHAGNNLVIVHDPTPLRSQVGLNRPSARVASFLARGRRPTLAVHSSNASHVVSRMLGVDPIDLLHPILSGVAKRPPREVTHARVVGVFGQYKPSRNLDLLEQLPDRLEGYEFRMGGKGWPRIAGWGQDIRFLSETELTESISGVDVVLIPNTAYYQSGIAIRAMELGVPVVGIRTPFLSSLYGDDYPGLLSGSTADDWVAAIIRAVDFVVEPGRRDYRDRVDQGWRQWLARA